MPFSFLRDRFRPATRTAATVPGLRRISAQTVRNRLHTAGLRARQPAVRLLLQDRHRAARRAWAREHVRWTRDQWRRVIWSDESRFCLQRVDGRIRVWRRRGERHSQNCIVERDRGRGGSVCVLCMGCYRHWGENRYGSLQWLCKCSGVNGQCIKGSGSALISG